MLEKLKSKLKAFISDEDRLIHEFDKQHPEKSVSQQKEINKYADIQTLRDSSNRPVKKQKIWDKF